MPNRVIRQAVACSERAGAPQGSPRSAQKRQGVRRRMCDCRIRQAWVAQERPKAAQAHLRERVESPRSTSATADAAQALPYERPKAHEAAKSESRVKILRPLGHPRSTQGRPMDPRDNPLKGPRANHITARWTARCIALRLTFDNDPSSALSTNFCVLVSNAARGDGPT